MTAVAEMGALVTVAAVCAALGIARASYYRRPAAHRGAAQGPARKLATLERAAVLEVLHEPRFADQAPAEVYATLLDESRYLCSERTMYRVLAENSEVRERRSQLRHPKYTAPELLATKPNQLWSWDITKLRGPAKWTYFYLYVILSMCSAATSSAGWSPTPRAPRSPNA